MASKNVESGKRRERRVARILSEHLCLELTRIPASGAGSGLGDLVDANGQRYEVKKASTVFPVLKHVAKWKYPQSVIFQGHDFILVPVTNGDYGVILWGNPPTRLSKLYEEAKETGVVIVLAEGRWIWLLRFRDQQG